MSTKGLSIVAAVRPLPLGAAAGLLLALATACTGGSGGAPGQYDSPGGRIYLQNCAGCHGAQAGGGVGPPLNATGHAHHHSDADLTAFITEGVRTPGAPAAMPGWNGRLSPEQIRQVVDFMKTLWTPEQRAAQQASNPQ